MPAVAKAAPAVAKAALARQQVRAASPPNTRSVRHAEPAAENA
jgi:hypothetical protein